MLFIPVYFLFSYCYVFNILCTSQTRLPTWTQNIQWVLRGWLHLNAFLWSSVVFPFGTFIPPGGIWSLFSFFFCVWVSFSFSFVGLQRSIQCDRDHGYHHAAKDGGFWNCTHLRLGKSRRNGIVRKKPWTVIVSDEQLFDQILSLSLPPFL